jgi:hypothetical protein
MKRPLGGCASLDPARLGLLVGPERGEQVARIRQLQAAGEFRHLARALFRRGLERVERAGLVAHSRRSSTRR